MRVVIGQYDLDKDDNDEMIFNIEDVIMHEKWNNRKDQLDVKNDIALIKIRRKGDGTGIELSGKSGLVRPACLPSRNSEVEKDAGTCTIAGWGDTKAKKENENCLRSANVPLISNTKCKQLFEKSSNPKKISKGKNKILILELRMRINYYLHDISFLFNVITPNFRNALCWIGGRY